MTGFLEIAGVVLLVVPFAVVPGLFLRLLRWGVG